MQWTVLASKTYGQLTPKRNTTRHNWRQTVACRCSCGRTESVSIYKFFLRSGPACSICLGRRSLGRKHAIGDVIDKSGGHGRRTFWVIDPANPSARRGGGVLLARFIAESFLGRKLGKNEIVVGMGQGEPEVIHRYRRKLLRCFICNNEFPKQRSDLKRCEKRGQKKFRCPKCSPQRRKGFQNVTAKELG